MNEFTRDEEDALVDRLEAAWHAEDAKDNPDWTAFWSSIEDPMVAHRVTSRVQPWDDDTMPDD